MIYLYTYQGNNNIILFHHSFISNFVKFIKVEFCKSYYTIIDVVSYPNIYIIGFIIRDVKKSFVMYGLFD